MAYENLKVIKLTIVTIPRECKPGCLRVKYNCANNCRR